MSEEKASVGNQALGIMRKFHPFALILAFALMYVNISILNSSLPLEEKILPYILSLALFVIAVLGEFYRIEKERELRERALIG